MARMQRMIMGLTDRERVSLDGWCNAFDTAREAGHVAYKSGRLSVVHPRTIDALVKKTWTEATGLECASVDYGVTGCKGKHSNASWYAKWKFDAGVPGMQQCVIFRGGGLKPIDMSAGAELPICTNGMFARGDAHMRFPQVQSLHHYLQAILIEMADKAGPMFKQRLAMREALR